MAFALYLAYHIRHHSCLNTQARSNSHPMLLPSITRVTAGEKGPQPDRDRKPQVFEVCACPHISRTAESPHISHLRTVPAPGPTFLDFPPNKDPLPSFYLRQMQEILHQKSLQSCIIYCKCWVFIFCLFNKYLTIYYTKLRGLER